MKKRKMMQPNFDFDKFHEATKVKHPLKLSPENTSYEEALVIRIVTDAYEADTTRVALLNGRVWIEDFRRYVTAQVQETCERKFKERLLRIFELQ